MGIIGAGNHFKRNILPVIKQIKSLQINGFLKTNNQKKNLHKYYNESTFFKKNFDFIYISTPNHLHEKFIIKSLKNNFHVLCEKPILTSLKNFKKIKKLANQKNKLIYECFMFKNHSVFNLVKTKIDSQTFGKPKYLISNFAFPSLNKNNNRYKKNLGGGFVYDIVSYFVSLENSLFKNFNNLKIVDKYIVKDQVPLRGYLKLKNKNFEKFYFWGDRQKYKNNIEIFFDRATIYIDFFYSKPKNLDVKILIFEKNREKIIKIKKENHFLKMFLNVIKNHKKKKFRIDQINAIEKQTFFLKKILNHK